MERGICEGDMLYKGTCMQNGESCVASSCPFDFYDYEEIEENCSNCIHIDDVDGSSAEYACPIYICSENPGYGNLLSFPFKKKMECFEPKPFL